MTLKVILPTQILLDVPVTRVVAEALNGWFGLLPRHIDTSAALTAGILVYEQPDGSEAFVGLDGGILVKRGPAVQVSTRRASCSADLSSLRQVVRDHYERIEERERLTRSALARLESGVVRRFIELRGSP